jgi:hypothetical protein
MADKLKEKSESVSEILVMMVVAGILAFYVTKEAQIHWFQSQSMQEEVSKKISADMENDIKTAQDQATVEKTKTMILVEKLRKDTAFTLNAASTEKQKLSIAANIFFGAYFMSTRSRPDYCASLGIPINSFVSIYKQKHYQLFTIAEKIQIQDHAEYGYIYDVDKLYKLLSPSGEKMLVQDMKDISSVVKVSERELCQSFEQDAIEWVNWVDFRKKRRKLQKYSYL